MKTWASHNAGLRVATYIQNLQESTAADSWHELQLEGKNDETLKHQTKKWLGIPQEKKT